MTLTHQEPSLTQSQLREFYFRGFLAMDRITDDDDIATIRQLLDDLFARFDELPQDMALDLGDVRNHKGVQRTPQVNDTARFEPRLKETRYFRNAHAVAKQLIGDDVQLTWDHAILKPAHNGRPTPWHQDMAYGAQHAENAGEMRRFGCNFWLPLQDTSVDAGCMQFMPHSHLSDLLPHHPAGHDPKVHTLETDLRDTSNAVPCPLKAGGCTIHQPKTLHFTAPNITDHARHAYILFFGVNL